MFDWDHLVASFYIYVEIWNPYLTDNPFKKPGTCDSKHGSEYPPEGECMKHCGDLRPVFEVIWGQLSCWGMVVAPRLDQFSVFVRYCFVFAVLGSRGD